MNRISLVVACVFLSACSGFTKGGSPTAPDLASPIVSSIGPLPMHDASLAALVGAAWTGVETADAGHGENGQVNATFFSGSAEGYFSARLQFIGRLETVNGSLSGTLSDFVVSADAGGTPTGTRCSYGARGARTEETDRGGGMIEVISGRYDGRGPDPCQNKAGTFRLQRPLIPPPCVGGQTFTFTGENHIAVFPPGFVNPWYPITRGPFAFTIPAGQWHFFAVTGDEHSVKQDGTQKFEIMRFPLFSAGGTLLGTPGPTLDIPDDRDTQASDLGTLTLAEPVATFWAMHAYTGPPVEFPTHSLYPVTFRYECPSR